MKYNIKNMLVEPDVVRRLIDGLDYAGDMITAFVWKETPQGERYWRQAASKTQLDEDDLSALREILKQYEGCEPKFKVGDKVYSKTGYGKPTLNGLELILPGLEDEPATVTHSGSREELAGFDYLVNGYLGAYESELELAENLPLTRKFAEDETKVVEPTLYIIMRTDIQDMNPGKAAAQAAHAQADAEAFMRYEAGRYIRRLYKEWKGDLNFGRTLVIQADLETIEQIVFEHVLSGFTVDPTYPWENYQGTTFTSSETTCAWAFVHPKDLYTKSLKLFTLSLML